MTVYGCPATRALRAGAWRVIVVAHVTNKPQVELATLLDNLGLVVHRVPYD
jgi:hypothetical protein